MAFDPNAGMPNTPASWDRCVELLEAGANPQSFGFSCSRRADIYRFGNRYRLAKSLTDVVLDSYGDDTQRGYTSLLKTFLTWSCFESYLRLLDLKQEDCGRILVPYNPTEMLDEVRKVPQFDVFFGFLHQLVRKLPQRQLADFLSGNSCNATYLASAIRHVFAHGTLSANPQGVTAENVVAICRLVNEFCFTVLDGDFSPRVN